MCGGRYHLNVMPPIGLNTWLYASFPVWTPSYTLEDALTKVDENGYDVVEIGAASPHAWPPYMKGERLDNLQGHLDSLELEAVSICPALGGGPGPNPASPIEEERQAALDHYIGCMDVAEAFDAEIIDWVGGWMLETQRYEDAWVNMRRVFEQVVEDAEDREMTIAIEANAADVNLIETPDDQLRLLDEVPSDNVGTMFDTAHAMHRGESPTSHVEQLGDSLVHIHLCDNDRQPPGEGTLSFRPMLDRLRDIGYDGALVAEIFGSHLNADEAAMTAQRNLKDMISDVF